MTLVQLYMILHQVEVYQESNQISGVRQEESLDVLALLVLSRLNRVQNHLIDVLKDSIDGLALLLLLRDVIERLKGDAAKLEEDAMREIEVVLAGLHDQVNQLFHGRVVSLQVERDELGDVKL